MHQFRPQWWINRWFLCRSIETAKTQCMALACAMVALIPVFRRILHPTINSDDIIRLANVIEHPRAKLAPSRAMAGGPCAILSLHIRGLYDAGRGRLMTDRKPLVVHITSYREEQAESVAETLRRLHGSSDKRHQLTNDPESADLILVGGIGNEVMTRAYLEALLNQETISRYPNKCFTVSFRDKPIVLNRGVFESASRHWLVGTRAAAGAYRPHQFSRYVQAYVGNPAPIERDLLFTFVGRNSHPVRLRLFALRCARQDVLIEDSSSFSMWKAADAHESDWRQRRYCSLLRRSKFAVCPRGVGTGSIRLFEAMSMGICPVILADDWIPPRGPDWSAISIRIREKDVARLEEIVEAQEPAFAEMGERARHAYLEYFADATYFNYVVDACATMQETQLIPESAYWSSRHLLQYFLGPYAMRAKAQLFKYYLSRIAYKAKRLL